MSDDHLQELDRILKLWSESQKASMNNLLETCSHEERHYTGFMEEYDFCLKCDAKKINGEWIKDKH